MKTMTDHPEPTANPGLAQSLFSVLWPSLSWDGAPGMHRDTAYRLAAKARELLAPEARRAALPASPSVEGLAIAVRPCIVAALAGLHTVDETTTQVAARVLDYLGKRADLPSPPATPAPVEQLAELEQITRFYHEWVQKAFEAKAELDDIHRLVDPDGVRKDVTTAWLVEQAFNGRGVSSAFFHIALSAAEWNDLTQDQRATLQAWMGMVHDKRRVQPAKKGEL